MIIPFPVESSDVYVDLNILLLTFLGSASLKVSVNFFIKSGLNGIIFNYKDTKNIYKKEFIKLIYTLWEHKAEFI